MNEKDDDVKNAIEGHSKELAKLGIELSGIQFNYKVKNEDKEEYWGKRIEHFKKHHQKGMEYYNKAYFLMNLIEKEKAGIFLLNISKLHQLGKKIEDLLEQVKQNPSIMSSKDKLQSKWSKNIKEQLIEHSNTCLEHEKEMNTNFREFYERHLKNIRSNNQ